MASPDPESSKPNRQESHKPEQPIITPQEADKLRKKYLSNICKKIIAGKTPTSAEMREINAFLERGTPATETAALPETKEWVSSYSKVGKIVGLHSRSFARIIRDNKEDPLLPKPRDNGEHSV